MRSGTVQQKGSSSQLAVNSTVTLNSHRLAAIRNLIGRNLSNSNGRGSAGRNAQVEVDAKSELTTPLSPPCSRPVVSSVHEVASPDFNKNVTKFIQNVKDRLTPLCTSQLNDVTSDVSNSSDSTSYKGRTAAICTASEQFSEPAESESNANSVSVSTGNFSSSEVNQSVGSIHNARSFSEGIFERFSTVIVNNEHQSSTPASSIDVMSQTKTKRLLSDCDTDSNTLSSPTQAKKKRGRPKKKNDSDVVSVATDTFQPQPCVQLPCDITQNNSNVEATVSLSAVLAEDVTLSDYSDGIIVIDLGENSDTLLHPIEDLPTTLDNVSSEQQQASEVTIIDVDASEASVDLGIAAPLQRQRDSSITVPFDHDGLCDFVRLSMYYAQRCDTSQFGRECVAVTRLDEPRVNRRRMNWKSYRSCGVKQLTAASEKCQSFPMSAIESSVVKSGENSSASSSQNDKQLLDKQPQVAVGISQQQSACAESSVSRDAGKGKRKKSDVLTVGGAFMFRSSLSPKLAVADSEEESSLSAAGKKRRKLNSLLPSEETADDNVGPGALPATSDNSEFFMQVIGTLTVMNNNGGGDNDNNLSSISATSSIGNDNKEKTKKKKKESGATKLPTQGQGHGSVDVISASDKLGATTSLAGEHLQSPAVDSVPTLITVKKRLFESEQVAKGKLLERNIAVSRAGKLEEPKTADSNASSSPLSAVATNSFYNHQKKSKSKTRPSKSMLSPAAATVTVVVESNDGQLAHFNNSDTTSICSPASVDSHQSSGRTQPQRQQEYFVGDQNFATCKRGSKYCTVESAKCLRVVVARVTNDRTQQPLRTTLSNKCLAVSSSRQEDNSNTSAAEVIACGDVSVSNSSLSNEKSRSAKAKGRRARLAKKGILLANFAADLAALHDCTLKNLIDSSCSHGDSQSAALIDPIGQPATTSNSRLSVNSDVVLTLPEFDNCLLRSAAENDSGENNVVTTVNQTLDDVSSHADRGEEERGGRYSNEMVAGCEWNVDEDSCAADSHPAVYYPAITMSAQDKENFDADSYFNRPETYFEKHALYFDFNQDQQPPTSTIATNDNDISEISASNSDVVFERPNVAVNGPTVTAETRVKRKKRVNHRVVTEPAWREYAYCRLVGECEFARNYDDAMFQMAYMSPVQSNNNPSSSPPRASSPTPVVACTDFSEERPSKYPPLTFRDNTSPSKTAFSSLCSKSPSSGGVKLSEETTAIYTQVFEEKAAVAEKECAAPPSAPSDTTTIEPSATGAAEIVSKPRKKWKYEEIAAKYRRSNASTPSTNSQDDLRSSSSTSINAEEEKNKEQQKPCAGDEESALLACSSSDCVVTTTSETCITSSDVDVVTADVSATTESTENIPTYSDVLTAVDNTVSPESSISETTVCNTVGFGLDKDMAETAPVDPAASSADVLQASAGVLEAVLQEPVSSDINNDTQHMDGDLTCAGSPPALPSYATLTSTFHDSHSKGLVMDADLFNLEMLDEICAKVSSSANVPEWSPVADKSLDTVTAGSNASMVVDDDSREIPADESCSPISCSSETIIKLADAALAADIVSHVENMENDAPSLRESLSLPNIDITDASHSVDNNLAFTTAATTTCAVNDAGNVQGDNLQTVGTTTAFTPSEGHCSLIADDTNYVDILPVSDVDSVCLAAVVSTIADTCLTTIDQSIIDTATVEISKVNIKVTEGNVVTSQTAAAVLNPAAMSNNVSKKPPMQLSAGNMKSAVATDVVPLNSSALEEDLVPDDLAVVAATDIDSYLALLLPEDTDGNASELPLVAHNDEHEDNNNVETLAEKDAVEGLHSDTFEGIADVVLFAAGDIDKEEVQETLTDMFVTYVEKPTRGDIAIEPQFAADLRVDFVAMEKIESLADKSLAADWSKCDACEGGNDFITDTSRSEQDASVSVRVENHVISNTSVAAAGTETGTSVDEQVSTASLVVNNETCGDHKERAVVNVKQQKQQSSDDRVVAFAVNQLPTEALPPTPSPAAAVQQCPNVSQTNISCPPTAMDLPSSKSEPVSTATSNATRHGGATGRRPAKTSGSRVIPLSAAPTIIPLSSSSEGTSTESVAEELLRAQKLAMLSVRRPQPAVNHFMNSPASSASPSAGKNLVGHEASQRKNGRLSSADNQTNREVVRRVDRQPSGVLVARNIYSRTASQHSPGNSRSVVTSEDRRNYNKRHASPPSDSRRRRQEQEPYVSSDAGTFYDEEEEDWLAYNERLVATRPPLPSNRGSDERNSRPAGYHREYYGSNESTGSTGHRGSNDALSRRHSRHRQESSS